MASELSSFIEKELARKGYDAVDLEDPDSGSGLVGMQAMRIEVRRMHAAACGGCLRPLLCMAAAWAHAAAASAGR